DDEGGPKATRNRAHRGAEDFRVANPSVTAAKTCRWTILGDAAEVLRSDSRGKILAALSEAPELMTPSDIVTATGLGRQNVDQLLHRMHSDGEIIKRKRGFYAHASRADLVSIGSRKNGQN